MYILKIPFGKTAYYSPLCDWSVFTGFTAIWISEKSAKNLHITGVFLDGYNEGVTKRCRFSKVTNSAFVFESKCAGRGGGGGGGCGVSANEYSCEKHMEPK